MREDESMRQTTGAIRLTVVAAATLAFGCSGGSTADVMADLGIDNLYPDAEVTDEADTLIPDLPSDLPGNVDADADTFTDLATADIPVTDATKPLREIPFAPPPFANPVVDRPFVQETNHTAIEVEPGIGPLIAVLLPPAILASTFETPSQVTPRGLVTHDAGGALRILTTPDGDRDLVGAAFLSDGILLAGPQRLYTRDGNALIAHELPAYPAGAGDIVAVDQGNNRIFLRMTSTLVGVLGSADPVFWPDSIAWPQWPNVTALAETVDNVFLAMWNDAPESPIVGVGAVSPAEFTLGVPGGIDPILLPGIALSSTGIIRALVTDVTLPMALDLVAVGDSGLAGLMYQDGLFTAVDVPLFAAGRVPLDQPSNAIGTSDGGLMVGTKGGAYRIRDVGLGPEWHVYNSQRWLPDSDVRCMATDAATADAPLYFATPAGLASVTTHATTIETKMAGFINRIVTRHDRDGAVADSRQTIPGDWSTNIPWDSDNDGGWTCYWVLAECFRWKVTGDPGAKANFDKSLERMLSFRTLTDTDWFVARSVIRKEGCRMDDCDNPGDGEWFSSPDNEWWVKSDTSNDEVTSHMFMMGHAYDVCADTAQKAAITDHVRGIVGGLIDHEYNLLKPDGVVTTYGQFGPDYVNGVVGLLADGGRRSVQMLAALDLALYLTNDPKFAEAKRYLIQEHHYDENVRTESERPGRRGSGDGDELGMQAFFVLLRYETDPDLYEMFMDGWHRTYANIRQQEAALWDVVNGVLGGESPAFENALRWLRLIPVDGIRWPQHNLQRKDLAAPPEYYFRSEESRFQRSDGHPLPVDERPIIRHNTSQYEVEGGLGSNVEIDGADVVAAYWMARYHRFVIMQPE
jgi:hypothetical protein